MVTVTMIVVHVEVLIIRILLCRLWDLILRNSPLLFSGAELPVQRLRSRGGGICELGLPADGPHLGRQWLGCRRSSALGCRAFGTDQAASGTCLELRCVVSIRKLDGRTDAEIPYTCLVFGDAVLKHSGEMSIMGPPGYLFVSRLGRPSGRLGFLGV